MFANKINIKLRNICIPITENIIKNHNKPLMTAKKNITDSSCNCNEETCLLKGRKLRKQNKIIYKGLSPNQLRA